MKNLSLGKYHRLQQCSTSSGAISILAMDHRSGLERMLQDANSVKVNDADLVDFKEDVVRLAAPASSAVLLDPEYGIAHVVQSDALPSTIGLIATIDESGYTGDSTARHSKILTGWSVEKASRLGADGIKLLVYYHPKSATAGEIEDLVKKVAADCHQFDLPFFLETLSYPISTSEKKLAPDERLWVIPETARRLSPLGADILKTEFPVDISMDPDETTWAKACKELTHASAIPWILLSAAVAYDKYSRQVRVACEAGASGVAVGRAVWVEAVKMHRADRQAFFQDVVFDRMKSITELCNAHARPWKEVFSLPVPKTDWYLGYPGACKD